MASKPEIVVPAREYTLTAVRSSGPGGQHVNKVSTAVVLRFDIAASSLPEKIKIRLLNLKDKRISSEGILVIKSGASRSQLMNRQTVIDRLHAIIHKAAKPAKRRIKTKPPKSSVEKRLQKKSHKSELKSQRKKL